MDPIILSGHCSWRQAYPDCWRGGHRDLQMGWAQPWGNFIHIPKSQPCSNKMLQNILFLTPHRFLGQLMHCRVCWQSSLFSCSPTTWLCSGNHFFFDVLPAYAGVELKLNLNFSCAGVATWTAPETLPSLWLWSRFLLYLLSSPSDHFF